MPVSNNYILRLQRESEQKDARIAQLESGLRELQVHLDLPKFNGVDADGSRKDWIATGDVNRMILEILSHV